MRAPDFWHKQSGFEAFVLTPASWLYRLGSKLQRHFAKPYQAKIPTICIGNVVAGGAGKTPTALAIAEVLKHGGARPVFVTRGYGGFEKGPLQVDPGHHTAADVGDEALLLARSAPVWVARDRAAGLKAAETHGTHIIMDDGFQNPYVKPDLSFLVIDAASGLGNEKLIPAGPMREPLSDAMKRAAAVILIGDHDDHNIAERIHCPVIRARIQPHLPADFPKTQKFFAFAGIAMPDKFYQSCARVDLMISGTRDFPDHHPFTAKDIEELHKSAEANGAQLLTTEKDWIRLPYEARSRIRTFPIRLRFDDLETMKALL
ncbi:MAG: tetraacyldisaccharide 4'-kinase [Alphaproteobacteria bacterium]